MKEFLVQLDGERNFLTRVGLNGVPLGTPYPSFAAAHSYEEADRLARRLRDQGYELALVCDRYGKAVSANDLDALRAAETPADFYSVMLDNHRYFVRLQLDQGKWRVIDDRQERHACGLVKEDADKVVENLRALGHEGAHAYVNNFYSVDIISELADVWPSGNAAPQ